jgi:hypothetical protein
MTAEDRAAHGARIIEGKSGYSASVVVTSPANPDVGTCACGATVVRSTWEARWICSICRAEEIERKLALKQRLAAD